MQFWGPPQKGILHIINVKRSQGVTSQGCSEALQPSSPRGQLLDPWYTAGENVKQYSCCAKQYGKSSKSATENYHVTQQLHF